MRCRVCWSAFLLLVLVAAPKIAAAAATGPSSLADYLGQLNAQGVRVVFSSDLVTPDMRFDAQPDLVDSAAELAALIRPFGLSAKPGPGDTILVVAGDAAEASAKPGADLDIPIPEIVVTSSLHRLQYSPSGPHSYLDRELSARIPAAAEEVVRLTNRLPGTASGGISARNHVRGGEVNEVLFQFDGLRLYEPYHLKDFQSIATIVNSQAVGSIDFFSGAYPARYGDRMSGVMDISLREPEKALETEISLSFFNTSILSLGTFGGDGRGDWLLSARRGNLDLVADIIDPEFGSPHYQDYLAHVGWDTGGFGDVSVNYLVSDDKLTLFDTERGENAGADYTNQVTWFRWRADWRDDLYSDTVLAWSSIKNRRNGTLDLPGIVAGELEASTAFEAVEIRQDWRWTPSDRWMLQLGVDAKHLDAEYRFFSTRRVEAPFDTLFDNQPLTVLDFDLLPEGAQYAAYTEFRWRPVDRVTLDLGLRWDQQTYTTAADDRQYSPRASVLLNPSDETEVRLGWGQYYQAQEINELQIADGVDEFFAAQRAEHFVLNVRHRVSRRFDIALSAYRKSFRTIRPRYENQFNALTLLPELQFDRLRIDAASAEALGAELMLTHGTPEDDLLWWLSYTWSRVQDETAAGTVARGWDQAHTAKGGVSWHWGRWDLSLAGEVHTGWPKNELTGEIVTAPDGSTSLVLSTSPRNALAYSTFHTLDFRVSREYALSRGSLTVFLDVTNAYDRSNACCIEYSLAADGSLASRETHWLPLLPSLGVVWRF